MAKIIITVEDTKEDSVVASAVLEGDREGSTAVVIASLMMLKLSEAMPGDSMQEISVAEYEELQGSTKLDS